MLLSHDYHLRRRLFNIFKQRYIEKMKALLERSCANQAKLSVLCVTTPSVLKPSLLSVIVLFGCGKATGSPSEPQIGPDTARIALTDLGARTYLGFVGGLYPGGSNSIPASHATRGAAQARLIQPLNAQGQPAATGKIVLVSIGMSNTTQEFCAQSGTRCDAWTFGGQAAADPAVNRTTLVIANGASGGQTSETWDSPDDANYNRVRDQVLMPLGVTEAQVQIAWVKVARSTPRSSLPNTDADAYVNTQLIGNIARALKRRYPNIRQMFVSSRIYAGFASTQLNPEPYAYETGFANKWVIEAQIRQLDGGAADARAGDLSLSVAPWMAWGPYLWAGDSTRPRGDGFFWVASDFQSDGTHPAQSGEQKVGRLLLDFFKTSPHSTCWFLANRAC